MIKKIILLLLTIAAVYGAVASPYSITETLAKKEALETAIAGKTQAETTLSTAKKYLVDSKNAFESQRSFDIHYSDLYKITQMLDLVSGISFAGLAEVDPNNGYAVGSTLNPEDYADTTVPRPSAVKLSMVAESTAAGLDLIEKMALPVVSITTQEVGRIDVIFLTGGES